ncbi:aminoglycoside phosphotransferase family protein [Rugosimonospora acidiphila]|uniref:Aminoglycoside phosphotransferase family protein n=1 Tax=Rugosimonospora acidiphila TaxID=556531 RepID=A0ABP9SUF1_9ACTN
MDEAGVDPHGQPIGIQVPRSFLEMPRWWREGSLWLEQLPDIVRSMCSRWRLSITGDPVHGSNALVIPVRRDGSRFVLRVTPPGTEVAEQASALRFWDGRGTVRLIDVDEDAGALLLERLEIAGSLLNVPAREAMVVLGAMMRRLAVTAPTDVPSTTTVVADRMITLEADWRRLGRPFDERFLRRAIEAGSRLCECDSTLAVNGDLHSAQVLRGSREPWLTVDPVLMRGDIAFDLARVLWTRVDEMRDEEDIVEHFDAAVAASRTDRDRGRDWVRFRAVDYWLWGLDAGLTEDPRRCRRLVLAFAG